MNRDQFLAARKQGIGGSDAAACLGFDAYKTSYELYLEKTGALIGEREDTERMKCGRYIENAIADLFADKFNVSLHRKPTPIVHPDFGFMRGNIDRRVVGERSIVECKNVDRFVFYNGADWGEDDTDQIPLAYLAQVSHYMACGNYERAFIAVLVGGNEIHRFIVTRDHDFEESLITSERQIWKHIEERVPPPIDFAHPAALKLMRRRYPGGDGRIIELAPEANEYHLQVLEGRELEKHGKAMQDEGKARLLDLMAGASIGRLSSGGEYRYSNVHRGAYQVPETDFVTLRHCKTLTKIKEVA